MKGEKDISDKENVSGSVTKKRRKKTAASYAVELLVKILVTVVVVIILCVFVVGIHVNHSNSSYPMVKDGDLMVTYKLGQIQHGQEVIYRYQDQVMVGRIIATGGEEVDIIGTMVTVNGLGITEDTVYTTEAEGAAISFPYRVPEGQVFILNDFRADINDSRTFGAIPETDVEGNIVFILRRRGI